MESISYFRVWPSLPLEHASFDPQAVKSFGGIEVESGGFASPGSDAKEGFNLKVHSV